MPTGLFCSIVTSSVGAPDSSAATRAGRGIVLDARAAGNPEPDGAAMRRTRTRTEVSA